MGCFLHPMHAKTLTQIDGEFWQLLGEKFLYSAMASPVATRQIR